MNAMSAPDLQALLDHEAIRGTMFRFGRALDTRRSTGTA